MPSRAYGPRRKASVATCTTKLRSPPVSTTNSGAGPPGVQDGRVGVKWTATGRRSFFVYCWIVTVGGVFVASTVMNRGMSRAGGGTGFSVVRSRLEPSAEYEYWEALL